MLFRVLSSSLALLKLMYVISPSTSTKASTHAGFMFSFFLLSNAALLKIAGTENTMTPIKKGSR